MMISTLLLLGCRETADPVLETGIEPSLTATITSARDTWGDDEEVWLLDERNEVQMVFGPAGGWTLSLDLEITGLVSDTFEIVSAIALPASGAPLFVLDFATVLVPDPDGDGAGTLEGLRLYATWLDAYDTLCSVAGEPLELSIPVEERATGRTTFATRTVSAVLDPANEESCAAR